MKRLNTLPLFDEATLEKIVADCAAEWAAEAHQGDLDCKRLKSFIRASIKTAQLDLLLELENTWPPALQWRLNDLWDRITAWKNL